MAAPDVSVVVPVYDEAESPPRTDGVDRPRGPGRGLTYEIVMVDDGSDDGSWGSHRAARGAVSGGAGRGLRTQLRQSRRRSTAVSPRRAARCGLHDGCRPPGLARRDSCHAAHDPRRGLRPGVGLEETAPRPDRQALAEQVLQLDGPHGVGASGSNDFSLRTEGLPPQGGQVEIEVYGEMHRYIPILARRAGFRRIGEKVVEHRARKYGRSKFGLERMIKGYLRPDYRVVHVPFRTLADVLLRQPRNGHVPARRRHHGVGHRRQALQTGP